MSVCNVLAYPAMSLWLNKTGRPILFSCSWPAYQEGQMKVSLIIQVCMLKEYATSHGLQSVPRSACWRPCVLPLCLCTSGHLMLSCWVAPPKSISAVGKPKLKLKNSLRRLTNPFSKFHRGMNLLHAADFPEFGTDQSTRLWECGRRNLQILQTWRISGK